MIILNLTLQNEVFLKVDHTNEKHQESPIVSPKMPSLLMRSPSFWKQTSAPQQHNAEFFDEKTSEERVTDDFNEVFLEDGHANEKRQESPIVSPKMPLILMRSPSFCSPASAPQRPDTKIVDEIKAEEEVTEDLVEADFFNQFEDDFDDLWQFIRWHYKFSRMLIKACR